MDMTTRELPSIHGQWSSRWMFILAATGAAVGLGNIWKFPYIAGENGGGAFVLFYLLCIILLGIPIMIAEIMLGRRGRQNPENSMWTVAKESDRSPLWRFVGGLGILAAVFILSYYSVIAGWAMNYIVLALRGLFEGASAQTINQLFDTMVGSPYNLLFWHSLMMVFTIGVVAGGVEKGLERTIRYLFPVMLLLLVMLVFYALDTGYFANGLVFLFAPNFAALSPSGMLTALGHAFFTLSLATGSIMMYGAYVPRHVSIVTASIFIACADTLIALLAGLAIFPIVFAHGLQPEAGPGLIFQTLPLAFGHMPYGHIIGVIFFFMLLFAAFTSAISLLEPPVAWMVERLNISRQWASIIVGFVIWLLGLGSLLSFNLWENVRFMGLNFFELMDYATANVMLPLGGLGIAVFTAWAMRNEFILDELEVPKSVLFKLWKFALACIAPVAITLVFLNVVGILEF